MIEGLSPSEIYERLLTPPIYRPWAEELVHTAAPKAGETVLDIASGPGVVARVALAHVAPNGRVVAIDNDHAMLDLGRSLSGSIQWVHADATSLPFDRSTFDLALSQQGLQFLPDVGAGLAESHRILKPGGRLVFSIWGPLQSCPAHATVFEELANLLGPEYGKPIAWSMPTQAEKAYLAAEAGFEILEVRAETKESHFPSAECFTECFVAGASRLTRQALEKLDKNTRERLVGEVIRRLKAYESASDFVVPMECHIVVARRH